MTTLYQSPRGYRVHAMRLQSVHDHLSSLCDTGPNGVCPEDTVKGTDEDVTCPLCRRKLRLPS
jgi:hypothetical protein